MCGRYTLRDPDRAFDEFSVVGRRPRLEPRYNAAPTQLLPVILVAAPGLDRGADIFRWGLVPRRAGAPLIMVRLESLARGAFGSSFRGRRCIVPADGFYEWAHEGRKKRPFHVHRADGAPLAIAGIWEPPAAPGAPGTFAVITKPAEAPVIDIHDRMPATVARADCGRWLDPAYGNSGELARMLDRDIGLTLSMSEVGSHVNSAANDDPACVEPLPNPPALTKPQ